MTLKGAGVPRRVDWDAVEFNAIVVAESLPANEVKTGEILYRFLCAKLDESPLPLPVPVIHRPLQAAADLSTLLSDLAAEAETRPFRPLLHIEAHGSYTDGLHFADDSVMQWSEFCDKLAPLNRATGLRLPVVIAACFGISIVLGMNLRQPAPCFLMIGPSDEVDPGEVLGRFRVLYDEMLSSFDASRTYEALRRDALQTGGMVMLNAQTWFGILMSGYLRDHFTGKRTKELALLMHKQKGSRSKGMREYKRQIRAGLPAIVRSYFESFFMYEQVPDSRARFEPLWSDLEKKVLAALARA